MIGDKGIGTLNLQDGHFSNTNAILGNQSSETASHDTDYRGSGTVNMSGGTWTNTGTLGIGESGTGTVNLNGGTLTVGGLITIATNATGTGTLNFGAYDLSHATGAGTLNASAIAFGSGAGAINFNQTGALTLGAAISGDGTVNQRGVGVTTLTGANTYTGATNILDGTLALGADGALSGSSVITVASGATFDVSTVAGGFTFGVAQTLSGNGTVRGDATIAGALASGGSPGLLTFDGNLALAPTATLSLKLGGTERGVGYDAIDVTGDLAYDGSLVLSLCDGFTLSEGDTFQLFSVVGTASGTFASVSFANSPWTGVLDHATGLLTVTEVPEPAGFALLAAGLALAAALRRRRMR